MSRAIRRKMELHPNTLIAPLIAIRGQAMFSTCLQFALNTALRDIPEEMHDEFTTAFHAQTPEQKRRLVRAVTRNMRAARREERQRRGYGNDATIR